MQVLEVGHTVFLLRFLPDGRRLVVGTVGPHPEPGGHVRRAVAAGRGARPAGRAAGRTSALVEPRLVRQRDRRPPVGRVVLHRLGRPAVRLPDRRRRAAAGARGASRPTRSSCRRTASGSWRSTAHGRAAGCSWRGPGRRRARRLARSTCPRGSRPWPGSCRTASGSSPSRRSSASGRSPRGTKWRRAGTSRSARSSRRSRADGRYLAAMGYGSMYFWDLTTLDKPRKISGSEQLRRLPVVRLPPEREDGGGDPRRADAGQGVRPGTLKQVHKWTWKLGPLRSVAYSPDGTVGAAGSDDGRVVVWDVDE